MTNQQWSIVCVVNDFLDPHWVQYSLLTQGENVVQVLCTDVYLHFNKSNHKWYQCMPTSLLHQTKIGKMGRLKFRFFWGRKISENGLKFFNNLKSLSFFLFRFLVPP